MNLFFVGYDLHQPDQHYERLWAALRQIGAKRILRSEWAVRSSSSTKQVFDYLVHHVDGNDALYVSRIADGHDAIGIRTETTFSLL